MGDVATLASGAHELVTRERLLDALRMLTVPSSRAGQEAELARAVCRWGKRVAPAATWRVDQLDERSANVVTVFPGEEGPEECKAMFYTHLDTTLSGDPLLDYPLTGVGSTPPDLRADDQQVCGFGLAVSKAPAACALVAYVAVVACGRELGGDSGPVGVLLSSGGTHRAPSGGFPAKLPEGLDNGLGHGVESALERGMKPRAVINVKGGAPGVLSEEPGCVLVRLEVRDRMLPVPARIDPPGAAVRAGRVAELVEEWRSGYVESRTGRGREIAGDAGVGAIESGLAYKPDLLPGVANVYVYIVALPEEDPGAIVSDLETHIQRRMPSSDPDWAPAQLTSHIYGVQAGASTDPESEVVRTARAAWEDAFGSGSADVRDYAGSTDGIIFRRHGIDTARLGVTPRASRSNPTVECVSWSEMLAVTNVYVDMLGMLL